MRCFNPHIIIPASYGQNFKSLRNLDDITRIQQDYEYGFQGFLVPCGKCSECYKARQDDIACRICREANKRGSMIFVTFTYREDALPISCRLMALDEDTGELYPYQPSSVLSAPKRIGRYKNEFYKEELAHVKQIRQLFQTLNAGRSSRRLYEQAPFPYIEGQVPHLYYEYSPSVSRRDFRLWLKRMRVRYEREHGYKLPEFSYCVVGEYGPKTCRPHLHACFMGLTYMQVSELLQDWKKSYGNVWIEAVKRVNADSSSGFLAASRYIGKYVSKGMIEADSVRDGLSEKPRICQSLGLGTDLTPEQIDYYSAYDLYGRYDPERLCVFESGYTGLKVKYLSKAQISHIQETIYKRSTITVDKRVFLLPKAISNKIWKYEVKENDSFTQKVKRSLRTYKIRRLAAISSSSNFLADLAAECEAYCSCQQNTSYIAARINFFRMRQNNIQAKIELGKADFIKGYSSSFL